MQVLEQRRASDESPEQGRVRAATGFTGDLQQQQQQQAVILFLPFVPLVEQHYLNNYPTKLKKSRRLNKCDQLTCSAAADQDHR